MMVVLRIAALLSDTILPNCSDISVASPVRPESTSFIELGFALTHMTPMTLTMTEAAQEAYSEGVFEDVE